MSGFVAVVGLGCVLPDAATPDALWRSLHEAEPALRLPDDNIGFDPRPTLGAPGAAQLELRGGYVVDRFAFDWRRYRTPPADVAATNLMQLVVLEAGTQALSTVKRLPRERTAIFVGATGLGFQKDGGLRVRTADWMDALAATPTFAALSTKRRAELLASVRMAFEARLKPSSSDNSVGSLASVAAARLAMHHDLAGLHYAVDVDVASSLAALEIGCTSLLEGEHDCVLVGGASELLTPTEQLAYGAAGVLRDGELLGEGAAFFACKRIEDALRDEDTIFAVVRGGGDADTRVLDDRTRPKLGHLRAASGAAELLAATLQVHHAQTLAGPWNETPRRARVVSSALSGQRFEATVESWSARHVAPTPRRAFEPLAIVGMGGRYSGAEDVPRFWERLLAGDDRVVTIPPERFSLERYHDAKALERTNATMGSFVELPKLTADDGTRFDDAPHVDPTQLLVARAAEEAVADAGGLRTPARTSAFVAYMPFQRKRFEADARVHVRELVAVLEELAPTAAPELVDIAAHAFAPITAASLTGWLGSTTPSRLAHRFGLGGPLVAIESACASTLAALHAAAQCLRERRCDVALVGGGYGDLAPEFYVATSRFNGLSPAGIAPFDQSAQGFVPGEGAGVFVVKRLDDARRDGDRIRAVVRGIGGSSDGRGRSVLTPSVEGESLALARALGDIDAATVEYVECHGTGTAVGDATEVMSLAYSYGGKDRERPLRIGSVKSNLGHLIAAAGAPALAKSVLALETGLIPPSLHCERPSAKIDFTSARIEVVRATTSWPRKAAHPRRAGVSAFGIGGSNFHVLLEQHRPEDELVERVPEPELFAFSGADEDTCRDAFAGRAAMLDEASVEDFAVAAADSRVRATGPARLAVVAQTSSELARKAELSASFDVLRYVVPLEAQGLFSGNDVPSGDVVVMFPGQGPQYAGMAQPLAERFPIVRTLVDRADAEWQRHTGRTLSPAMWQAGTAWRPLDEDLHAMVFVVSCAVYAVLRDFGLRASCFVGQSAGELAALVAAESLSFEDGLRAILARTRAVLALSLDDPGEMAAVATSARVLAELVDGIEDVWVAADNCPSSALASGTKAGMSALAARCAERGIELTPLHVSHAYHTPMIAPAGAAYRVVLDTLDWRTPRGAVLSTVDLARYDGDPRASVERLVRQYTTPVRFAAAIESLYTSGARVFFEAGPKWPLTAYVREQLGPRSFVAHATIHPKIGEVTQLLRAIACGWTNGVNRLVPGAQDEPAATASDDATFERVRGAIVAALAARTGYPADMLGLDLDLEGDLGIDTVKQVEVFGRVREELGLQPEPGLRIRELSTLRKVIERFASRLGSAPPTPPAAFDVVRDRIVRTLAERTGYPADMLGLDLDLEGDLGIDTVKQVEVFGRVREELGLQPEPGLRIRELSTLRKVIERFASRLGSAPPARDDAFERVRASLVAALAERTGYPEDMLGLDLDLEGDLGIDTVKQVEVFGRVRESLGLSAEPGLRIRDLSTLRRVIERFVARLGGARPVLEQQRTPAPAPRKVTTSLRPLDRTASPALGTLLESTHDHVVAARTFSLETDRYLAEAQLAGRRVVPSGIAWEALAETAALLLGGTPSLARDLKSAGPLLLDERGECRVEIEAQRRSDTRALVTLVALDGSGRRRVRFGGELEVATTPPEAAPRGILRALDRRGQPRNGHALSQSASRGLQLAETVGGCVWARSLSFCELIGGIRADSDRLFYEVDSPKLVLDPGLLECAFMLAGFGWYALAQEVGIPVDIERIEVGRGAEPDEEALCHVRLRGATASTVTADLTILGADHRTIMNVRGCRLMQVERMVDGVPEAEPASDSWARFTSALQATSRGSRR